MTTLGRHRIRLACNQDKTNQVINLFTGERPLLHRARGVQFELGIMFMGLLESVANLATLTLEIKETASVTGAPLATKTVSSFNTTLTAQEWIDGTAQHALVEFDSSELGLSMTGHSNNKKDFWLVISAVLTDGNRIPILAGNLTMLEDGGAASADTPAAGDPTFYTAQEVNALLNGLVKLINDPGATITIRSPSGNYSRTWTLSDDDVMSYEKEYTP